MKRTFVRGLCFVGLVVLTVASCSLIRHEQPYSGELKLNRLKVPNVMHENLPYDAQVTFETKGSPEIRKVCFRWLNQRTTVAQPSLSCYSSEVQNNDQIGSQCQRWMGDGPYTGISPLWCTGAENLAARTPESFTVKLNPENIKVTFNRLECHVEYMANGELKETNRVSALVSVEP